MTNRPLNPRDYPAARLLRRREPYAFQRKRHTLSEYPRPAQPNKNQQVARPPKPEGTDAQYWIDVYKKYQGRQ